MRKFTDIELQRINDRLEILRIKYLEIYEEIKDHYFSELEKKSADEFEATFLQLNEAFDWPSVKSMEKNLERSTNRLITQLQWNELKFWKLNSVSLLYPFLMMLALGVVYSYLDVEGMTWAVILCSLAGVFVTWYVVSKEVSISLKQLSIKPMRVFPRQILKRSSIFVSGLTWIYVVVINWNNTNSPGLVGTIIIWLLISPFLLQMLTLAQVALTWKKKKQHAISQ